MSSPRYFLLALAALLAVWWFSILGVWFSIHAQTNLANPGYGLQFAWVGGVYFSQLPPCNATTMNSMSPLAVVKDSTSKVFGTAIVGNGKFRVLAFCDGNAWMIAGV